MEAQFELNNLQSETKGSEKAKSSIELSKHAATGAMIACLLATLSILIYLFNMVVFFEPMISFVFGGAYNSGADFWPEATFVLLFRFIIVFCIAWLPSTAIIAFVKKGN